VVSATNLASMVASAAEAVTKSILICVFFNDIFLRHVILIAGNIAAFSAVNARSGITTPTAHLLIYVLIIPNKASRSET
jgi:hypothetical protein